MTTTSTIIPGVVSYHTINYNPNPIDFIDGMPAAYLLIKLRQHGEEEFNNFNTADAELHVEGLYNHFWIHKDYLVLQSPYFRGIFEKSTQDNNLIVISVPSPENFAPLLEYLYTGDGEKWYDTMNLDNYEDVWDNVVFLGLGIEAISICNAYYQNVVMLEEQ